MRTEDRQIVGVIPAGGYARRIAPLPCSKELFPIGFFDASSTNETRPKAVCQYLLESMSRAGVTRAYIVLRDGKWDIPAYLGDGAIVNIDLAYLVTQNSGGPAYTVDQAYAFVKDSLVAFGFPDIIFEPVDGFKYLLERQAKTKADIVLGLFGLDRTRSDDRVIFDKDGTVKSLIPGPTDVDLEWTWNIAIWTSAFTRFLHDYLAGKQGNAVEQNEFRREEVTMGVSFKAALDEGLQAVAVKFPKDWYLDIGTPDNLLKAVRHFSG